MLTWLIAVRFSDLLDPMRHPPRYRNASAITFELGGNDHHVPARNAGAFIRALDDAHPGAAARMRLQNYPGLDHLAVTIGQAPLTTAADWLLDH